MATQIIVLSHKKKKYADLRTMTLFFWLFWDFGNIFGIFNFLVSFTTLKLQNLKVPLKTSNTHILLNQDDPWHYKLMG